MVRVQTKQNQSWFHQFSFRPWSFLFNDGLVLSRVEARDPFLPIVAAAKAQALL
jgi:hypothetical protein